MSDSAPDLLNETVLAELLSLADTPEARAMVREIFSGFYAAAQAELTALRRDGDTAALRPRLHRLKGMMANYGHAACAQKLAQWESADVPGPAPERVTALEALFAAGQAELRRRHPWLA